MQEGVAGTINVNAGSACSDFSRYSRSRRGAHGSWGCLLAGSGKFLSQSCGGYAVAPRLLSGIQSPVGGSHHLIARDAVGWIIRHDATDGSLAVHPSEVKSFSR